MTVFHVTYLENLDSILSLGLKPTNTMENNFPLAWDNQHSERLFFMTTFEASKYWFRTHHPSDYIIREGGIAEECERKNSVIIEFDVDGFDYWPDPYQSDSKEMVNSFYVEVVIPPERIVDIHDPEI